MGRIEMEKLPDTLHSIFTFFQKMRLENIEWRVSAYLVVSPLQFSPSNFLISFFFRV